MDLEAPNKVSIKMLWRVSAENFEIQRIKIAQIGSEATENWTKMNSCTSPQLHRIGYDGPPNIVRSPQIFVFFQAPKKQRAIFGRSPPQIGGGGRNPVLWVPNKRGWGVPNNGDMHKSVLHSQRINEAHQDPYLDRRLLLPCMWRHIHAKTANGISLVQGTSQV